MMKSTPHAHTTFVDGKSTVEQMVQSALERGFASLGFSEHAVQPFDKRFCLSDSSEREYIAEVNRVKALYAERIAIYLGCERDRYSTADRALFEYVIGSAHYLPLGQEMLAIDGPLDQLQRLVEMGFQGDGVLLACAYFQQLQSYVVEYRPDIIGHFDLIQKHNALGKLFDSNDPRYERAAMEALEGMAQSDAILEVNTGGMARGYLDWPYPELRWLRQWRRLGGRVIISSDCHDAQLLDFGFAQAEALIAEAGYREVWMLNPKRTDGALFIPRPVI